MPDSVENALATQISSGACDLDCRAKVAALYRRAGVSVPEVLFLDSAEPVSVRGPKPDLYEILEDLTATVEAEGGGPYDFFTGLGEITTALPEPFLATFAGHFSQLDHPMAKRCHLYWIISGTPLVQEMAATALSERLKQNRLQFGTVALLPIIRGWMQPGANRDLVDDIGKLARKSGLGGALPSEQLAITRIVANIVDGVGAQSISIVGTRESRPILALLLMKARHGVKDAFVIPCWSKREANSIASDAQQATAGVRIDRATGKLLLEAALVDGVENGRMPPPGLIDMIEYCGLSGLRPQSRTPEDFLDRLDPERKIRDATQEKIAALISNERFSVRSGR